jgi:hypothetical protein
MVSVPFDLIVAGTSLATAALAVDVELGVVLAPDDELVLDDELLLPHAATAPAQSTEIASARKLLDLCITAPFPENGRQHKPEVEAAQTF